MKTLAAVAFAGAVLTGAALAGTINFDNLKTGAPPPGWTAGQTGSGAAKWTIERDETAPSPPNVLKQSGQATYGVGIKNNTSIKDGFVGLKFKPISSPTDRSARLI